MSGAPRRARLRAGGAQAVAHTLRPDVDVAGLAEGVAQTLEAVRTRGDDALVEGVRRFDQPDFTHDRIRVPRVAVERALEGLDEELRAAIVTAAAQVRIVAEALLPDDRQVTLPFGQRIQVRQVPVDAAGVYVPGGRAAYPSSLIMGVVPAQVAGVERVAVVSPPGPGRAALAGDPRHGGDPGRPRGVRRRRRRRDRGPRLRHGHDRPGRGDRRARAARGCRRPSARWSGPWASTASPGRAR